MAPDDPTLKALKTILLNIGGTDVVRMYDPDMAVIAARGHLFSRKGLGMIAGAAHRCHRNAAIEYLRFCNEQTYYQRCEIVVGYGLAPDDLWVPHSWLIVEGSRIRETCCRMNLYFGVAVSPVEAAHFVMQRVYELVPAIDELLARCDVKKGGTNG